MTLDKEAIGSRLESLRKSLGETQRGLAAKLGYGGKGGKQSVYEFEQGKRIPPAEALVAYKEETGATTDWILLGEGQERARAPDPLDGLTDGDRLFIGDLIRLIRGERLKLSKTDRSIVIALAEGLGSRDPEIARFVHPIKELLINIAGRRQ